MWTLYDMHLNKLLNSIVSFFFSHTSVSILKKLRFPFSISFASFVSYVVTSTIFSIYSVLFEGNLTYLHKLLCRQNKAVPTVRNFNFISSFTPHFHKSSIFKITALYKCKIAKIILSS